MTDHSHHRPPAPPDHLGPWPEATVAMYADLGLAEDEIARHLRIDRATVRALHRRAGKQSRPQPRWWPCRWLSALCAKFCGR